jgi:hypothetical protein
VSLGSLGSPKLLQSGMVRAVLDGAGVKVYLQRDNLGRRMREHRLMVVSYRLKENLGSKKQLATPAGVDRAEVPRQQEGTAGRACRLPARRDHLSAGFASSMGPPVCR